MPKRKAIGHFMPAYDSDYMANIYPAGERYTFVVSRRTDGRWRRVIIPDIPDYPDIIQTIRAATERIASLPREQRDQQHGPLPPPPEW